MFGQERILDLRGVLLDLVEDGVVSEADSNALLGSVRSGEQAAMHPLTYIGSRGLQSQIIVGEKLTELVLTEWLSDKSKLPLVHIDPMKVPVAKTAQVMSYKFAKRHDLICVDVSDEVVTIALAQPFARDWELQLDQTVRQTIKCVVATPSDIERYRIEFYSLAKSVTDANDDGGNSASGVANFEQLLELGDAKEPEASDQHIVNIVDWLLKYAFDQRASDIHIEPRREQSRMRFRIDGVLHNIYEFPSNVAMAIVSRLKILGRMNVAEKRKPQDGRIKTKRPNGSEAELRLSTMPTAFGEKMVMRIFDPEILLKSFEELGLVNEDLQRWKGMIERPHGIVLVTGPTGSGKTTTLYSSLRTLSTDDVNVSTIEDPIEMVEDAFNQSQVQRNIDFDFAAGIRTLMRQDPDIIMVGEIRDQETASMAVQAALTGHLVISTLHTNDATAAITRLLDLGIPSYLLRSTLLGVMAQRLIRTLCPHCKAETTISPQDWQDLVRPWKAAPPKVTYKAVGCLECRNTGYLGREGIYEIMNMSEAVSEIVTSDADLASIRQVAIREGMRTLRLSGAQKVASGSTTINEVLRVVPPAEKV